LTTNRPEPVPTRVKCALSILATAVFLGLWVVGIIPPACDRFFHAALLTFLLLLGGLARSSRPAAVRMLVPFIATALPLIAADLVLRRAGGDVIYRPGENFVAPMPTMPLVYRYAKNVRFQGETFGDLAAMAADQSLREMRPMEIVTDAFGFRNDPACHEQVLDLILCGDSFGAGSGTTGTNTFADILRREYGLSVYNLAVRGSPWQSLMNLKMELPRLRTRPGTVVLLAMFTGNDLDDLYGPLEGASSPRNATWDLARTVLRIFRKQSGVYQLAQQRWLARQREREQGEERPAAGVTVRRLPSGLPMVFLNDYLEHGHRTEEQVLNHPQWPLLRQTLLNIRDSCRHADIPFRIVLIPTKGEVYEWIAFGKPLKPGLTAESKSLYEHSGQFLWWRDDTHWNGIGHETAARIIHDDLLAKDQR
jgi:hypothetical protein